VTLEVKLTKPAFEFLNELEKKPREAIKKRLTELASDPLSIRTSKPLKNRVERSSRVGNYRILFTIEEDQQVLLVAKIGNRRDVYK